MGIGFPSDEPVLTIGLAAERAGIAVPTLRMYEMEELVIPYKTPTGRRLYSREDLARIECIRELIHQHGLNFAGIRWLLSTLPCWEMNSCEECKASHKGHCPVLEMEGDPCWVVMRRQGLKTDEDCRTCSVYRSGLQTARRLRKYLVSLENVRKPKQPATEAQSTP